jgi:hypothetical protein
MRIFNILLIPCGLALLSSCGSAKVQNEPTSAECFFQSRNGQKRFTLDSSETSDLWKKLKTAYDASSKQLEENRIEPEFSIQFYGTAETSVHVEFSKYGLIVWSGANRIVSDEHLELINQYLQTLATTH